MLSLTTVSFVEMSQCPQLNMYAELQICTTRIHKLLSDKVNHSQYESRHTHSVGGRRSTRLSQRMYRVFAKNKSYRRRKDKVVRTTTQHKTNTSMYTIYDVVRARAHAARLPSESSLQRKLRALADAHGFRVHVFKRVQVKTAPNEHFYKCVFVRPIRFSPARLRRLFAKVSDEVDAKATDGASSSLSNTTYPLLPFLHASMTAHCPTFRRAFEKMVRAFVV